MEQPLSGMSPDQLKRAYIKSIEYDDLTSDLAVVAECCGMNVVRTLIASAAGVRFYVPKPEGLTKPLGRFLARLNKERGGLSEGERKRVCIAFNVSERSLANLLSAADAMAPLSIPDEPSHRYPHLTDEGEE